MGLLGDIFSAGNTAKRRLRGLLDDPIGSMQQAVDNAFPTRYEAQNAISQLRGQQYNPDALQAYNTKLDSAAMNFAPMGMIVWHGSPHKFNKFDMSKIGTGEGAQAYGHGLYMADSPAVAKTYQAKVSAMQDAGTPTINGKPINWDNPKEYAAFEIERHNGDRNAAAEFFKKTFKGDNETEKLIREGTDLPQIDLPGQLYKVDIPDEAVARMLDWDKPLSQQAPEVQKALQRGYQEIGIDYPLNTATPKQGSSIYDDFRVGIGGLESKDANAASEYLKSIGIPGIRYLDGGSRSAGNGSSNFVLFDDALPRILEVNGSATGKAKWKTGEYGGLLNQ